jgi:hypothetical protein
MKQSVLTNKAQQTAPFLGDIGNLITRDDVRRDDHRGHLRPHHLIPRVC